MSDSVTSEIAAGEGVYLSAAARLFPSHRRGRPVSGSCLYRWITEGVRLDDGQRLRLEAARIAGRWVTSRAAIKRFIERQTPRCDADLSAIRTPTRRMRDQQQAAAALKSEYGI